MVVHKSNTVVFWSIIIICFISYGLLHDHRRKKEVEPGKYANYNILFVSFDALQASHMSCFGYFRKTTQNIDRFAQEGFFFKNAVSQSSWTLPSTMSWFTSLYPSQHKCINKYSIRTADEQILTNLKKLSPEVITLAEVLKENGYTTGGFTGDAGVSGYLGFNQGFDVYFDGPKFGGMENSIPAAIDWLRKNSGKKFFIFLHGYDCHGQYDPPLGYTRRFLDFNYEGPLKGGKEEQAKFREQGLENGYINLSDDDVKLWQALYDEKIYDADERFRRFMDEFQKMGLLDKTIVILTSDHGTEFYEHKRFDHGFSLYDELIHVPLIFWFPNSKEGKVIQNQVRAIDIMPTIFDLLNIKPSRTLKKQMKGTSLISLMNGKRIDLFAFSETDYRLYTHKRSIRTNAGWKFIYTMETSKKELYNLKNDPGELSNLVKDEPQIAYKIEQALLKWLKSLGQDEHYYRKIWANMLKVKEY